MSAPTTQSPWSVTANNKTAGDGFAIPPEDNHEAALAAIVDLGTHGREFDQKDRDGKLTGKKEYREYRQLFLVWELTDCPDPDHGGRNFTLGKEFSLSLGVNSALRAVVEVWKGRKLGDQEKVDDIHLMIGARFMIQVAHQKNKDGTRTYANIKAVTPVPKKMAVSPPKLPPFLFNIKEGRPFEPPGWLPLYSYGEKLTEKMDDSKELKSHRQNAAMTRQADEAFPHGANEGKEEEIPY
jgi:hypothetical protein